MLVDTRQRNLSFQLIILCLPEIDLKIAGWVKQLASVSKNGSGCSPGSAIQGDVVILAVRYLAEAEVIQQYAAQLPGKIVVRSANRSTLPLMDC